LTAVSLDNLGGIYETQGHFGRAELLYNRSLRIREKSFGRDHSETARSLERLAALYRKSGRERAAVALEQRAAAIRETAR
ncbi:MAG TPA: tetratricopeptide repeat protein, partial [Sedimentisphaerales bacterium]|nr:tetratricopeptide repeat protein [Sedimentisphaerales bacterium]